MLKHENKLISAHIRLPAHIQTVITMQIYPEMIQEINHERSTLILLFLINM